MRDGLDVLIPEAGYHRDLISCQAACPVHTDARGYVRAIADGRFEEAYLLARGPNPFASICGRVCGAPCEAACRRGRIPRTDADGRLVGVDRPIAIRALKRFVCQQHGPEAQAKAVPLAALQAPSPSICAGPEEMSALLRAGLKGGFQQAAGESIGIIGAGPAGLSAAHDLALMGFRPVVYELEAVPAGMLALGIPGYRLPRDLIAAEVEVIRALGVEIRCGIRVGTDVEFESLRRAHAAVILAVGAKRSRSLGLPGEAGPGVYGGVDFLRAASLGESMDLGMETVVIGGGNVAYDVARTVVRQTAFDAARMAARLSGASRVHLVSLETLEEMPADTMEIREGDEEGVQRLNGWGPVEVLRDGQGRVSGVQFRKCLRVYDDARRFAPVYDDAEQMMVPCGSVLLAAGQSPDLTFLERGGQDIEMFRPGWPKVDEQTLATTAAGVFVAGDLAHGTRLLIDAVASGKKVARSIYLHLTGRELRAEALESHMTLPGYVRERDYESIRRLQVPTRPPKARLAGAEVEVERGYSKAEACREASRCLDCGVTPIFDGERCVLCGGCVDVCPTGCLKLVPLEALLSTAEIDAAAAACLGADPDPEENSVILKDEDRCIRCGLCALRCPVDAITMERIQFSTDWRTA